MKSMIGHIFVSTLAFHVAGAPSAGTVTSAVTAATKGRAPIADGQVVQPLEVYKDSTQPIEARADDLLRHMTLEEKIAQTWAPYGAHGTGAELAHGVGQLSITCAHLNVATRNELQHKVLKNSRLGIPASFSGEALHSGAPGGTVFPESVTQGATWNPELVKEIAAAIATEARAFGVDTAFSPVINLWVDARFGRLQEGFSENPTLTSAYAKAAAQGMQGNIPAGKWEYFGDDKVVALAKHYAAYGAALGGLNGAPAELSERTLRDIFLKPWRAFASAGGKGAMAAHNTVLGRPCHANPYLVNDILRKQFGFGDGILISDCNDIPALVDFRTAANIPQAAARAMKGGIDLDLQCGGMSAYTALSRAISSGHINASLIDQAARRVLMMKFAVGLFEHPFTNESVTNKINSKAHQDLALRAAEEGIVLLKNDCHFNTSIKGSSCKVLPIFANGSPRVRKVAMIGPNADGPGARGNMLGSYHYDNAHVSTLKEALQSQVKTAGIEVVHERGAYIGSDNRSEIPKAVQLARESCIAILVLGDDCQSSAEWGDRDNLDLPGGQMPLLEAVVQTGTPVVLILVTGRTATFGGPDNAILERVPVIMSAFRPGQMGGVALANLITGKAIPSGKLAQNWVRSAGQVGSGASPWLQWRVGKWVAHKRGEQDPDGRRYNNYNDDGGTYNGMGSGRADPLFYFGSGLSYTTFEFSDLSVQVPGLHGSPATVFVTIANTGLLAGTEVVQVYIVDPVMEYVRPWKRLVAFQRVKLQQGETQSVQINLAADELAFYDDEMVWRVVPGEYLLSVGGNSYDAAKLCTRMVLSEAPSNIFV